MADDRPLFPGFPVVGEAAMSETTPTVTGPRPSRHLPDTSLTGFSAPTAETSLVEELLKKYQARPPEPPRRPTKTQMVIGALTDGLAAAAAVRAGGQPPTRGPFLSNVIRQQELYAERLAEFEQQRQRSLESLLRLQEQTNWRQSQAERQSILDLLAAQKQGGFNTIEEDETGTSLNVRYITDATGNITQRKVNIGAS